VDRGRAWDAGRQKIKKETSDVSGADRSGYGSAGGSKRCPRRSGVVNLVAAHKWFNLAALKGRADAIRLRREVAEMMSEVEIAIAQREARAWMTAH
jgi:hypothetical protein